MHAMTRRSWRRGGGVGGKTTSGSAVVLSYRQSPRDRPVYRRHTRYGRSGEGLGESDHVRRKAVLPEACPVDER